MKREVPIIVTTVAGIFMILEYFHNIPGLANGAKELQNWAILVAAFALALAAINLAARHLRNITARHQNAVHSGLLLASMFATVIAGIFFGTDARAFVFIFDNIITPCGSAFYAMACFHLASAAYRAFRAQSGQAAALLITGIIVMLGRAPIGDLIHPYLPKMATWLMQVPNLAGMRAIMISSAIGMIGVSLRIITGIDRTHLGMGQE
ncbi:MAG TPA: hypothetical protein GX529_03395 [Firmicutes bacterium]|nr:hypothetical protein [Candidatus Fermentithermobacillaceae bacterium]